MTPWAGTDVPLRVDKRPPDASLTFVLESTAIGIDQYRKKELVSSARPVKPPAAATIWVKKEILPVLSLGHATLKSTAAFGKCPLSVDFLISSNTMLRWPGGPVRVARRSGPGSPVVRSG